MRLLCRLVQVQGDLETSVRDMLMGLEGLWARLELLHTGVTLTKQSGRGREDLASAQTDSEVKRRGSLPAVLWFSLCCSYATYLFSAVVLVSVSIKQHESQ